MRWLCWGFFEVGKGDSWKVVLDEEVKGVRRQVIAEVTRLASLRSGIGQGVV